MVWNASLEDDEGKELTEANSICPSCKSAHTCEIVYGYPSDIEEYLKLVAEKKIYPMGCVSNEQSPAWHCNDCYHNWETFDANMNDSFDYDQGYNLDEVYDQ